MWYLKYAPDTLLRWTIRRLNAAQSRKLEQDGAEAAEARSMAVIDQLRRSPIAVATEAANEQHYELPPEFFQRVLGPRLKYSSAYWSEGSKTLADAEEAMLELYVERAQVQDGMRILDLGCGWGSLTKYLVERFPTAEIVAVSNSHSQRRFIEEQVLAPADREHVTVITADINSLELPGEFDRIMSVEMFEHMRNYPALFSKLAPHLKPGGCLFVHIFCHRLYNYLFEVTGPRDWMERYFFSGGTMPSAALLPSLCHPLVFDRRWLVEGTHYQHTANAWLQLMDAQESSLKPLFREVYGRQAATWWVYWRLFFLACAELFGMRAGQEWLVAHYRFVKPT